MSNKEALEKIIADYKFKEKIESGYVYHTEIPFMEAIVNIMKDLDKLDKITKILTDLIQYDKDGWLDDENIGHYLCEIEEWLQNEEEN